MGLLFNLSPNEVRNANGPVTPGFYTRHASVGIVTGPHGPAFDMSVATVTDGVSVPVSQIPGLDGSVGTMLVRMKCANGAANNAVTIGMDVTGESRFTIGTHTTANRVRVANRVAGGMATSNMDEPNGNDWIWIAFRWLGADLRMQGPSVTLNRTTNSGGPFSGGLILGNATARNAQIESVALLDEWITDDQLASVTSMPSQWSWASIEAALSPLPVTPPPYPCLSGKPKKTGSPQVTGTPVLIGT